MGSMTAYMVNIYNNSTVFFTRVSNAFDVVLESSDCIPNRKINCYHQVLVIDQKVWYFERPDERIANPVTAQGIRDIVKLLNHRKGQYLVFIITEGMVHWVSRWTKLTDQPFQDFSYGVDFPSPYTPSQIDVCSEPDFKTTPIIVNGYKTTVGEELDKETPITGIVEIDGKKLYINNRYFRDVVVGAIYTIANSKHTMIFRVDDVAVDFTYGLNTSRPL